MAVYKNVQNLLLNDRTNRLIIKMAEKIDAKLILLISKNVDKKKEISFLTNRYRIMERLKGKYRNNNTDMELKRLRSLKSKNKNEVIRMLDQTKKIFTEMEEIELGITNKKDLKFI